MEKQGAVLVYKEAGSKVNATPCTRYISCNATVTGEGTMSLIRQAGISGCGMYNAGDIVPENYPHSVNITKLLVPEIGVLFVDTVDFNANFVTQCNVCCIE